MIFVKRFYDFLAEKARWSGKNIIYETVDNSVDKKGLDSYNRWNFKESQKSIYPQGMLDKIVYN